MLALTHPPPPPLPACLCRRLRIAGCISPRRRPGALPNLGAHICRCQPRSRQRAGGGAAAAALQAAAAAGTDHVGGGPRWLPGVGPACLRICTTTQTWQASEPGSHAPILPLLPHALAGRTVSLHPAGASRLCPCFAPVAFVFFCPDCSAHIFYAALNVIPSTAAAATCSGGLQCTATPAAAAGVRPSATRLHVARCCRCPRICVKLSSNTAARRGADWAFPRAS